MKYNFGIMFTYISMIGLDSAAKIHVKTHLFQRIEIFRWAWTKNIQIGECNKVRECLWRPIGTP